MAPKATTRAPPPSLTPTPTVAVSAPVSGFSPDLWGPSMWFMMHLTAATYPDAPTPTDKANYMAFYKSLQHILPCMGCRMGYQGYIAAGPTKLTLKTMASRESLFKWTVDVHNQVNAKLRKPVQTDYLAWYAEYDKLR